MMTGTGKRLSWKLVLRAAILSALTAWLLPTHGVAHAVTPRAGTSGSCAGVHIRFFAGGDPGDAFASIVYRGAKTAAADLDANVAYIFSGWDVEKMISQLREAIAARPDGIAMMGHPGDAAIMPLAKRAHDLGILMEYQNVDAPKVRALYGGGYVGADLVAQGRALGEKAVRGFQLKPGMRAIVFGAWGQPGRYIREEATAKVLEHAGLIVQRITVPPSAAADPNLLTPLVSSAVLSHPDTKLIVYGGGQILGAVPQYMRAIHKTPGQIINIGFDLSPQILTAFQQNYVQLTSDQQPFLQGYLPILSLCMTKKFGFTPISFNTGGSFVDAHTYQSIAPLVKAGLR
jgi:simple sugar transport system substrate-binding protein